jgi:hypothetical protein
MSSHDLKWMGLVLFSVGIPAHQNFQIIALILAMKLFEKRIVDM